jgi:acetylornithine deacetylase/succinyl-diaminopimelate desuccinylase-like protein
MGHTDVVTIDPKKWVDHGPFSADLAGGYVYGRGTVDDKDNLVASLMLVLMLKRAGTPLDRDVIFLAESGEEADTTGVGINFMVREHFDTIDAEFAMTEGGGASIAGSRVSRVNIGTAEKLPVRARLVATGTAGHGSVPRLDNPLLHLAAALDKVGRWQTPMRLNDTTRTYFERLVPLSPPERAAVYRMLLDPKASRSALANAQSYLQEHEPVSYSILRTSVVPTLLKAGVGANVIPSEAEATLDIRALS